MASPEQFSEGSDSKVAKVGVARVGAFLTPGKGEEGITLHADSRVTFRAADGSTTHPHGNRHFWWTSEEGLAVLTVSFHYQGREDVPSLRAHTFYEVLPGLFRTSDIWQTIVFQKEIGTTVARVRGHLDTVKLPFVWLHPGRPPALVLMMQGGGIVYDAMGDAASEVNGFYAYFIEGGNEDAFTDTFTTSFHFKGEPTDVLTILRRPSEEAGFWRVVGDLAGGIPGSTRV